MSFSLGSASGEIRINYDGAGVQQAIGDLGKLQQSSGNIGEQLTKVGGTMIGLGATIGLPLIGAVNAAADFEQQMDAVSAALGGVPLDVMSTLEQQALDLGSATKFSAGEVAGVQEALGKAGIGADQLLDGATQAVLDLSAATGESLVPSAEAAAAAMNLFGLEGDQVTGVADTFTAGLNNSSASLSDFQRGINNLGPVMANLARYAEDPEQAFTDTAAAIAYFNAQGLKAADAGVSLARGMTNLADPTSDATATLEALGISAFDANGNFLPLPDLFDQLQASMSGMSDQAREQALATIFGAEAADVMNQAIKNGGDGLREYEALMESSGQAAEQAAIRQDNLRGALEELGGAVQTAAIALGTGLLDPIRSLAESVTGLVQAFIGLSPEVQKFIATFGALSAIFLTVGGGALLAAGQVLKLAAAFGAAELSLAKFALALGLVGLAIGAGILAYQSNFLGFADAVDATLAKASKAAETFAKAFKGSFDARTAKGINGAAAAIDAFGDALLTATGIDITGFTSMLADGIDALARGFQFAIENGFNPAATALHAFAQAAQAMGFEGLASSLHSAASAAQAFGHVFEQAFATEQTQRLSSLSAGIAAFGTALSVVLGTDVTGFFDGIANSLDIFTASFNRATEAGINPFQAALLGLRDALSSIVGFDLAPIFDAMGTSLQAAADAVRSFVAAIQEGNFATAGQMLADLATSIGEGLAGLVVDLTDWVLNIGLPAAGEFVGGTLVPFIQEKIAGLGATLGNFTEWVLNVGLPAAGAWIGGSLLPFIQDKITGAGSAIVGPFVDWTLNVALPTAGAWIGGSLVPFIQEKIAALGTIIPSFVDWTLNVGLPAAGEFIGDLATWIQGKLSGIATALPDFVDWTMNVGIPSAGNAVGDFAAWIRERIVGLGLVVDAFSDWTLNIGAPSTIEADLSGISDAISTKLNEVLSSIDPASLLDVATFSSSVGAAFADAFAGVADAIIAAATFDATPVVNAVLEGLVALGAAITAAVVGFAAGFVLGEEVDFHDLGDGIRESIESALTNIEISGEWVQGLSDAIIEMLNSAAAEIAASAAEVDWSAIPTAIKNGIGDALADFGSALFGASEAKAGESALDPTEAGQQFGEQLSASFSSPEFAAGLEQGMGEIPAAQFQGIATSILTKIQEAISISLQAQGPGAVSETGEGHPLGADMGSSIITSLVSGLTASLESAQIDPSLFTSIGASLLSKIQEGISAALAGTQAPGGVGPPSPEGGGIGTAIVTSLATSLAASITAAPVETFAAIGTAIQAKLSEVLATALSGGGGGAPSPGLGGGGAPGIGQAIAQMIAEAVGQADFAAVGTALQTALTEPITTAVTQVGTNIATGTAQWMAEFTNAFTNIQTVVTNGMTNVTTAITNGMTSAQTAVTTAISGITTSFTTFATEATTAGTTAGTGFSNGLLTGMQAAASTASTFVSQIVAILNSAADGAYSAGAAVGDGFASGMESALGRVEAAANAMVAAATNALAAAAQIASPSKVTMALGEEFGLGFALGIAGQTTQAGIASNSIAQEAIRALTDRLATQERVRGGMMSAESEIGRWNQHAAGLQERGQDRMPESLEATLVMDDQGMGRVVIGKALAPLLDARNRARRGRFR